MQTLTEKVIHLSPPGGLFDDTVVRNLFPRHEAGARRALVHRALLHREVFKLKRGLYYLAHPAGRFVPHPFVVAGMLHAPSQVSLESALAYHELIPEAVHQVASVTNQRGRVYQTPLGSFSFARVPCDHLRAGVQVVEVEKGVWAFIAAALRAIADIVYVRRQVEWDKDGLGFLTESLRIEYDDLTKMPLDSFDEVVQSIRNKRTRHYLEGMHQELAA